MFERSVDQLAEVLRTVGLPELFVDRPPDPQALKQALIKILINEAAVLERSLTGTEREFLAHWMRRFEIINLKTIIRGKLTKCSPDAILKELVDLGPMAALPVNDLVHTEDITELLRRLEISQYADLARQARRVYEESHDLFSLEATIDRHYFAGLAKRVNALPDVERRRLRPLSGILIDQTNLTWLLRYRFAYELAPPHAYFLLAPSGYHLDTRVLLMLVQLASFDEVIQKIPPPLGGLLKGADTVIAAEAVLEREVERVAWSILRYSTFNLARAFAFLLLREKQILLIHIVAKGKQLQLDEGLVRVAAGLPRVETDAQKRNDE
jgi:V/A-type H+-transporting ATPase subunit C